MGKAYEGVFTAGLTPEACCIRFFPGLLTGPCVLSYPCRWGNNFTVWHMSPGFPSLTQHCSCCNTDPEASVHALVKATSSAAWAEKWSGRRPEATTSVVEVTAYPARLLPSITWADPSTNNSNSAFSMGVSAISLVAAYVSVTQSWVISPSSSNTNSVIADIIHEDGFVTGARCITIFGAVRVAKQFPQREEVTEVTFA